VTVEGLARGALSPLWALAGLALGVGACGADEGSSGTPAGGSGAGGSSAGAGGATAGGSFGSGGLPGGMGGAAASGGAATGGASPGSGGAASTGGTSAVLAGCSSTLAAARVNTAVQVSDRVIDYPLTGAPAAKHFDVLILMFNASSRSASTPDDPAAGTRGFYTPRQLGDTFFGDPNGVHAYLNEASGGKVSLAGRVVGWIDLGPQTTPSSDFRVNVDTYAAMATSYANFADYDVVYINALTDAGDVLQLGWGLQNYIRTSQGTATVGIDYMINSPFFLAAGGAYAYSAVLPSRSWAHELLHTFGISGHDLSLDCGQATYGASCASIVPYGNPFSAMGESALGNHPSIEMKDALGWLDPGQLPSPAASGTQLLCPTETVDGKPKGLSIPLSPPLVVTVEATGDAVPFDRLFVEYRRALGFDRYVDRLGTSYLDAYRSGGPIRTDGVLVSLGYADRQTQAALLLDMHPGTPFNPDLGIVTPGNLGRMSDAALLVGETFSLPAQGVTLEVKQLTDDGGIAVDVRH
jgi:hypothetical protein